MSDSIRKLLAALFAGALLLTPVACSDEDGDGAVTDEEVDELEQNTDDAREEIEQEVDEGQNEVEENNGEGGE
jgi:hypothetical protein